ncbi:MAG TPA: aminoacyl-tRNA hydrolase [Caldilineaceae bacterium]|nr:aminoacyl-tRNA hydrolase [Caldilineaceae bacterium]
MSTLKMIVGLGNPGPQYQANRHNIGFQCVDRFAQRHRIELSKLQLQARTGEGWVRQADQRQKVLLVKPMTYMNNSGQAVAQLARYYRVTPDDILVIHDDIDLAAGKLRLRMDGSSGGQNGIKSIIQQLGASACGRVRVGLGRAPGPQDPADFVLQNFNKDEEMLFAPLRERVCDAVEYWLFWGMAAAMNRFNGATHTASPSVSESSDKPAVNSA